MTIEQKIEPCPDGLGSSKPLLRLVAVMYMMVLFDSMKKGLTLRMAMLLFQINYSERRVSVKQLRYLGRFGKYHGDEKRTIYYRFVMGRKLGSSAWKLDSLHATFCATRGAHTTSWIGTTC